MNAQPSLPFLGCDGQRTTDNGRRASLSLRARCSVTVRSAFCFLLSAFCFLPSALYFPASGGRYQVKEVKPHVFVWVADDVLYQEGDPKFRRAGTAGFVVTTEGVVVVNTTNSPFNGRDLLYEIRKRTDQPIKYVIDTDASGEHTLGNEVFVDQPATIISTGVARAEMLTYQEDLKKRIREDYRLEARMRGFHPTLPTQTFDNQMTLRLGGEEIKLLDLGKGMMAGDAAVYLPREKVLFLGDLYENGIIPPRGLSEVHTWLDILKQVDKMDVEIYVPGAGPPGKKDDLTEFRQFLQWVEKQAEPSALLKKSPTASRGTSMANVY
jgi:glyoxylase-like metal-dependent hydrolase (beta-lactamase superfamily II)